MVVIRELPSSSAPRPSQHGKKSGRRPGPKVPRSITGHRYRAQRGCCVVVEFGRMPNSKSQKTSEVRQKASKAELDKTPPSGRVRLVRSLGTHWLGTRVQAFSQVKRPHQGSCGIQYDKTRSRDNSHNTYAKEVNQRYHNIISSTSRIIYVYLTAWKRKR